MITHFCDICEKPIDSDKLMESLSDFLNDTVITIETRSSNTKEELILCGECKRKLLYALENRLETKELIESLGTMNRIRLLFKRKIRKEAKNDA